MSVDPHRDPAQLEDDLAAYALGALGPDEATEISRHVAGCEACTARLRWLQPAVDVLPASVEQRTPPPRLRENLMELVNREAASAEAATSAPARPSRWASLRGFALRPATAIAVLVLLVAGIGVGYLLRGDETTQTLVKAEPLTSGAPIAATLERSGDSATLHVNEMPALKGNEVYEVWVQRAGVMEPRNTFVLASDGSAEAAIPGPFDRAQAVFVTREPRGGSSQPTTKPLLKAPL